MTKICSKCENEYPRTFFKKGDGYADGRRNQCKYCTNAQRRKTRVHEPISARRHSLRSKYGMELEDYDEIHKSQDGCCAICDTPEEDCPRQRLAVDHDHKTNEVRGLLCDFCNMAIGKMKDSPKLLNEAIEYLQART